MNQQKDTSYPCGCDFAPRGFARCECPKKVQNLLEGQGSELRGEVCPDCKMNQHHIVMHPPEDDE